MTGVSSHTIRSWVLRRLRRRFIHFGWCYSLTSPREEVGVFLTPEFLQSRHFMQRLGGEPFDSPNQMTQECCAFLAGEGFPVLTVQHSLGGTRLLELDINAARATILAARARKVNRRTP